MKLLNESLSFISKVKHTLQTEEDIQEEFFQLLCDAAAGNIDFSDVAKKAKVIFKGHAGLFSEFNSFLPNEWKLDLSSKKAVEFEEEKADCLIEMVKENCEEKYECFLENLIMYRKGQKNVVEVCSKVSSMLRNHQKLLRLFYSFIVKECDENEEMNVDHSVHKRKKLKIQHTELVESSGGSNESIYGDQVTTSYRLLHTRRSRIMDNNKSSVLNNICVSAPEAWNSSHEPKLIDPYEERLNKIEEERFEADMLRKSLESTIRNARKLLNVILDRGVNVNIEGYLDSRNLRCIEKLYGDCGLDILELLKTHPRRYLPRIIERLKQKEDEFMSFHLDQQKVWDRKLTEPT